MHGLILAERHSMVELALLAKYNVPVPRYTSYPTVPNWQENIDIQKWEKTFRQDYETSGGISIYIHLPFCESLCTYCGCNKKITTNHSVEEDYLNTVLKEWQLYRRLMEDKPVVRELHLGGGTPTFFSPENLERLISGILEHAVVHPDQEFSFEGHPNNTTKEHLEQLFRLGFRRVSFGVQDNDPEVQRIINRLQPLEQVKTVTEAARGIGYKSVNFDLIYGLPRQSLQSITTTIQQTIALKPDRIAFYSYAHVPWTSRGQRLFDENDLPGAAEKLQLYQAGKTLLIENGYHDIGMDHFALPGDDLYKASVEGHLNRNFMGYTTQSGDILLGMGVSAISSTSNAFAQNAKTIHNYYDNINKGSLAIEKGYFLTGEDKQFGKYITDISCRGNTLIRDEDIDIVNTFCGPDLDKLEADGLITFHDQQLSVTPLGRNFTRNICSAFDLYIQRNKSNKEKKSFSNAI